MKKLPLIISVVFIAATLPGILLAANTVPQFPSDSTTTSIIQDIAWDTTLSVTDADIAGGDSIEFTLLGSPGLTLDNFTPSSADLSWTPLNSDVGTHWVSIVATDSADSRDTLVIEITVANRNDAPSLEPIANEQILFSESLSIAASASDPDSAFGDSLIFSLSGEPNGMVIDSLTGAISYDPPDAVGDSSYTITVTVTDDSGAADSQFFGLEVDNPPEAISNLGVSESNGVLEIAFTASPASDLAGYTLYYGESSTALDNSVSLGNSTTYQDSTPPYGTRHYYAVAAVDNSGFTTFSNDTVTIDLTTVSGIWNHDQDIQGDITVPDGSTLYINGATIRFALNNQLIVNGVLKVNETGSDTVSFLNGGPDWDGIRFIDANSDTSLLRYVKLGNTVLSGADTAGWGAGVFADNSFLRISHSEIYNNETQENNGAGGGIALVNSWVHIQNSLFYLNTSYYGAALYSNNSTLKFKNNTVIRNRSGSALKISGGSLEVRNNIIAHNTAGYGIETTKTSGITTNLFFNNKDADTTPSEQMAYRPSNFGVPDSVHKFSGAEIDPYGNLFTDPLFRDYLSADVPNSDLRLQRTSPAVNMGSLADSQSATMEPEPNGDRINMGAYGGTAQAAKTAIRFPYNFSSTAIEDSLYSEEIDVPRDDDLMYFFEEIPGQFPDWLTLDDTPDNERVYGTPTNTQSGNTETVSIRIYESSVNPVSDTVIFDLEILNSPPAILNIADTNSVAEDSTLTLQPAANDADVTWRAWLDESEVSGTMDTIGFNSASGAFYWTPANGDVGYHSFWLEVDDGKDTNNTAIDTSVIIVQNTNDPPLIDPNQELNLANAWLEYADTISATDPDSLSGDSLTYTLLTGPDGLTVEAGSGILQWTPFHANFGSNAVTVFAEDLSGARDTLETTITVVDTVGPEPPDTLEGTGTDTTVFLSWSASPSGDLTSYNLYRRRTGMSGFTLIDSVGKDTLEYTNVPLLNDTTYYYFIAAEDSANNSENYSDTLSVMPQDTISPEPPTNFAASDSNGVALFHWDASPTSDVTNYRIIRSFDQSEYTAFDSVDANELTLSHTLDTITTMWFAVQALDESGNSSDRSNIEQIAPFGPPTNFLASNKAWRIELTWDAVTNSDADLLRIYRGVNDSTHLTLHAELPVSRVKYVDQVNGRDTCYYAIAIRDTDGASESSLSDIVTGIPKTKGAVAGEWTLANSPYEPTGSIIVDEADTLTLHDSTTVLFQGYYDFIVYGSLLVRGSADSMVTLSYDTTISSPTGYPNWKGITFSNAGENSVMDYARVTHTKITGTIKGGAIRITDSNPMLSNSVITSNQSYSHGGAIAISGTSSPIIERNVISGNTSTNGYGGGIAVLGGSAVIRNNGIADNSARDAGAVYIAQDQSMEFYNNTVRRNGFTTGTTQVVNIGGIWDVDGNSVIHSSIFTENSGYSLGVNSLPEEPAISYNLFYNNGNTGVKNGPVDLLADTLENTNFDTTDIYGNMAADPRFVNESDTLQTGSPALDAGKPTAEYTNEPEPNGDQVNIGRYGNTETATTSPIRLRESIPDDQQPLEDAPFEYIVSGRHDAGATVTYDAALSEGSEWLSFSQVDNTISGDPTNDHVGTSYSVTIFAEDEEHNRADTAEYAINVTGRPPQITGVSDTSVVQDELLELVYSSDDDPDVSYSVRSEMLSENPPIFSGDTLRWIPANDQTGDWIFEIWAVDNHDDSSSIVLEVNVSNVNDQPVFVNGDSLVLEILEKELWSYRLDTVTVDADTIYNDSIAYSLENAPPGLSFSDTSTVLEWTPTNSEIGTFNFYAVATDLQGETDTLFMEITTINVNDSPAFIGALDTTILEDSPIRFPITVWESRVIDPDPTDSLESLEWTFTSLRNLVGVSRTSSLDSIIIEPLVADSSGIDSITVEVADTAVTIDTVMVVAVQSVNDTPVVVSSLPDSTIDEDTPSFVLIPKIQNYFTDVDTDDSLRFAARALDPGMDSLQFSGSGQVSRIFRSRDDVLAFNSRGGKRRSGPAISRNRNSAVAAETDSTALIAFPTPNFDGEIRITVSATDDSCAMAMDTTLVTVIGVNDTPVVAINDTTFAEDDTLVIPLRKVITEYEDTFAEMAEIRLTKDTQSQQGAARRQLSRVPEKNVTKTPKGIDQPIHVTQRDESIGERVHHRFTAQNDTLLIWGDPNYFQQRPDRWELYARDSDGAADSANFQLMITSVNDPPVFGSPVGTLTTTEDSLAELTLSGLRAHIIDPDTLYSTQYYTWDILVADTGNISVKKTSSGFELHPAADWFGSEEFIVQVKDIAFTVHDTALLTVSPVNDPPSVQFPATFTLQEDDSMIIDLDEFGTDIDNDTSELEWELPSYVGRDTAGTMAHDLPDIVQRRKGKSKLLADTPRKKVTMRRVNNGASASGERGDILSFRLDSLSHELTVIPEKDSTVSGALYTIEVMDPEGEVTGDTMRFTVTGVNDPPRFVSAYPDTSFSEHDTLVYTRENLLNTVQDVDTPDEMLDFTFEVGDNLLLAATDTTYAVQAARYWFGQDTIWVTVNDGLATDSVDFLVDVYNGNDAPVWTERFPDTTTFRPSQTREFILRDSALVYDPDPDTPVSSLTFEVKFGSLVRINYNSGSTRARLFVLRDTTAVDTVYFTAIDPQGARGRHQMTVIIDPTYVGVDDETLLPKEFVVEQNYPNPFNPVTTIEYGLPEPADVALRIYNLRGQNVFTKRIQQQAGYYQFQWNGKNTNGEQVGSGMYIYMVTANTGGRDFRTIRKMVLIR